MARGYSYLTDQSAFIEKPSSVLAKYDIFDYKMDVDKMLNNNTIPNTLIFERSDKKQETAKNFKRIFRRRNKKNSGFRHHRRLQSGQQQFLLGASKEYPTLTQKEDHYVLSREGRIHS